MKHMTLKSFLLIQIAVLTACSSPLGSSGGGGKLSEHAKPIYEKDEPRGITAVPSDMGSEYLNHFDRYTELVAPSGGKIRIVAQNRITNEQILRARGVLSHYLSDKSGTLFGGTKAAVADRMASNAAVLTILNYRDDGSNKTEASGQSLFEEELPVEGTGWYMENRYEAHRDAAFEEILHMVHDYGIGIDGKGGLPGALPEYQRKVRAAQRAATGTIWGFGADQAAWLRELEKENSLSQEYLAAVIDSWYGLWGAWNDPSVANSSQTGMWGFYLPKTRAEVGTEDPAGAALAQEFFCEWVNYDVRIDAGFGGMFSLRYDPTLPYTHKSRYLKDITFTGSKDCSVRPNGYDNSITGNEGWNRVHLSGNAAEYALTSSDGVSILEDKVGGRDGRNTLKAVEELVFKDKSVRL